MKIRQGFVSNSSSSSFVQMTTKENHEKALEKLSPIGKAAIMELACYEQFLGKDVVVISEYEDRDGNGSLDIENFDVDISQFGDDCKDDWYNSVYNYKKEVAKIAKKGEVFTNEVSW